MKHWGCPTYVFSPTSRPFRSSRRFDPVGVPLKVLFLSRITPAKGVELAIEAVKRQNDRAGKIVCRLDIFGQLDPAYAEQFKKVKSTFLDTIRHLGFIDQKKFFEIVAGYDLLVFPTYYIGEGFPGVIINAYI